MQYSIKDLTQLRQIMIEAIDLKHKKFSYALERNIERCDSEIKKARNRAYGDPSFLHNESFTEYVKQLRKLEEKHGKMDESGKVLHDEHGEIIANDPDEFKRLSEQLALDNPEGRDILVRRRYALEAINEEIVDVKIYTLLYEDMLPDTISVRDRVNLRFMFSPEMLPDAILERFSEKVADGNKD